jgi:two-component system nitrate/nitrite response regulator NarL
MITAALVSGDQLFREAFGRLGAHIGVAVEHQADTVAALLAETDAMPQLVILVGWTTGDAAFLDQVAALRERTQGARLLVLTDTAEPQSMHEALQAGVDGFLHRNMSSEALSHSIRLIMYGQAVVPMSVVSKFLDTAGSRRSAGIVTAEANSLTPRERDILSLLAEGQPNKVIARRLGTCDGTVKVHLRRIMRKLGVQNRTQAAIWALDHLQGHEPRELAS